tara:strand:- start:643 stop:1305 length:663 start_codon:yes stop_codon:yes gene_type:complete
MIKVKNLSKSFNNQLVLDNISIEIKKGDFLSIVGPSGAGKTTFLNILGTIEGYDKNPKTSILFNNFDITNLDDNKLSSFRNKEIGFIFQFHQLLPELTAQENILLPSMIGKRSEKESIENLNKLSNILEINNILNKKPEFLSGGEKQRVAVARALINSPSILLADEPTGNLDSKNAEKIQKLFKKINSQLNVTIVLVTHNKAFSKIADKCLVLSDGKWSK